MEIKEKKHFGAVYKFTKVEDSRMLGILRAFFGRGFDPAELRAGRYVAEVLHALRTLGAELSPREYSNLVPNVLRYEMASLIAGNTITPTLKANKIVLGSSATVVDHADTKLGTETLRADFSDRYSAFNVAYLDKFFGSSEVGGMTFNEAGIYVDGGAGVDSGYLFSHVNISEAMTATESLTVNCVFTITD